MLLLDHQRLWIVTTVAQLDNHKNAASVQCVSTSFLFEYCSCLPAKVDSRDESSRCRATQLHRDRQELLWRQYFRDPTLWRDGRQDKHCSRSPDFKHKDSKQPLWLNSFYKPAWVDAQLTLLDAQIGGLAPSASNTILQYNPGSPTVPQPQGDVTPQTVSEFCSKGLLTGAIDALTVLVQTQSSVSTSLLYSVLRRCVAEKNLVQGRRVHYLVDQLGYESNTFLSSLIVRMYACQGSLQEAMNVFSGVTKPSVFMWSCVISAHTKYAKPAHAIQLYLEMRRSGVKADGHVFVAALQACAIAADLESGKLVHSDVLDSGVPPDSFVCSSLVDMYAKCGSCEEARILFDSLVIRDTVTWNAMISGYAACGMLEDARRLFDTLDTKNVVTWTAMIAGYAEHGLGQEALALYARMEKEGQILADSVMYICLLKACASAGALQQGRQFHSQIVEKGLLDSDIVLGNCLVDMYAKCGKLLEARMVLESLVRKDVVAWNAMIGGYGRSNEGHMAIACFEEMLLAGVQPNDTTFTCLLVACSHEGLVNEGRQYFKAMVEQHGIAATIGQYNCMIDLLGRAGHLGEAECMLLSCDSKMDAVGLMSLLNACRSHGDIERGARCFESLIRLHPQHASAYVLMANMYADAGRWTDVDRIERVRKLAGASKKPAVAGIEVKKQVHTFVVGDETNDISSKVRSTNVRLKEEGHVPHTKLVLKPLCENEKEDELCGHAEKLALAYGLLNTPNGTPLLVTKNLRMCRDCHSSTEIMSRIEKRDIVVRDSYRVHRFEAGSCSCKGRP